MQKNVSGQRFVVFAFNRTTNIPLTGDAANITANLQIDFGTSTATNDVNPAELEDGYYSFDATQAETNGDVLVIYPASVTADIQVIGVPGVLYTDPVSFADGIIQSADNDTKISLIPTTAMRGTDSAATSAKQDTMETTLNAIPTTAMRGTDNAATAASLATVDSNVDAILVDTSTTIPGQITGLNDFNPSTEAVANVTLVATTTTNTDMRGTDSANTVAPDNTSIASILVDTGTTLPAQISALNDISAADVWTVGVRTLTAFTFTVNADIKKINAVTIVGDGSGSPFDVS